jgi:hypothetical protein
MSNRCLAKNNDPGGNHAAGFSTLESIMTIKRILDLAQDALNDGLGEDGDQKIIDDFRAQLLTKTELKMVIHALEFVRSDYLITREDEDEYTMLIDRLKQRSQS